MTPGEVYSPVFSDLDRHFGRLMEKLSGSHNPAVFLAAALVSRSCREGHVCLDLATCAGKAIFPDMGKESAEAPAQEMNEGSLPVCPEFSQWEEILRASSVVGIPGDYKPLILDDDARLYLYRYWFYEDTLVLY